MMLEPISKTPPTASLSQVYHWKLQKSIRTTVSDLVY